MSATIRVGLVGYGFASKTFHAPLLAGTPGVELVAVASSDASKVLADWPAVNVVADAQQLFNDPDLDLIVIPTPNATHFPLAQQALAAGKHVVVDKPFTLTAAEARDLQQQAQQAGLLLSVFHNRRWDSDFLTVKQLLAEKTLGDVVYFESHFDRFRPQVRQRWREADLPGSGIWYDLGSHLLDQALQLFGRPDTLSVDLAKLRPGGQSVDYFHALLDYPGRKVVLHGTVLAAAESPRYQLHGTQGSYVKLGLDPQEDRLKAGDLPPSAEWGKDTRDGTLTLAQGDQLVAQRLPTVAGNYPAYYAAIRDAILGKGENPVTAEQAIEVMALLELGEASAKQKKALPYLAE